MACCAACSMDPSLAIAARPDAIANMRGMGSLGAPGDILPTIVWPSDVVAYKRKLSPDFDSTNRTVLACSSLDAPTRAAWDQFYVAWSAFRNEPVPTFGAANKYDEAASYESRLAAWQKQLSSSCPLSSPIVTPPDGEKTASAVKAIAIAAVVGAVVYGLHSAGAFHAIRKVIA